MNPDHPLLRRAQEALKRQLLANKTRIEHELREKQNALKSAKSKREAIGVELYGFQQNLAKLQLALEQTHQNHQAITNAREQAENDLKSLKSAFTTEEGDTKMERARVEKCQMEVDRLSATLKQIESYNEQMKSEIAVTRRAAYAAEEAVQKLEKAKMEQDFRIDTLQENLRTQQQQLKLYTAQLEAQKRETRAALETLVEAETEMEGVHFEKKQLLAQWKSSVLAIQKRDEALSAIQDAMHKQQEQERSLQQEIEGFRRDIIAEQLKNEQLTGVLRKLEGDQQFIVKQSETATEKQSRLQELLTKLSKSLEHTEEQLRRTQQEQKALQLETDAVERAKARVDTDVRAVEEAMLSALSDQTTTEKASAKTIEEVQDLRRRVRAEEVSLVDTENELAKVQVDILNTEAHNTRLTETLALLDEELDEKTKTVEKYELEIKRRNDEIEKKTRDIDILNRKFERMVENMEDEETGPLEATIKNLQQEIDRKGVESRELQTRWLQCQTELVTLQSDNENLVEALARMKSEQAVMFQKKRRLEQQMEQHDKEVKALIAAMGRLRVELQHVNELIATNGAARTALAEDNFNLENKIVNDLKDMELESAKLSSQISEGRNTKQDVLAEIVEAERQIMLWERKIQLEKEMQEVLDPTVGQDVVSEMRKEIHRMQLRHGELMRLQEKLISDMEKALSKRDLIAVKGRATATRAKQNKAATQATTRAQLDRQLAELQRSIRETEKESAATDARVTSLEVERDALSQRVFETGQANAGLKNDEEGLRNDVVEAVNARYTLLLATHRMQKTSKRLEEIESGKFKRVVEQDEALDPEIRRARGKLMKIIEVIEALKQHAPQIGGDLDKILCHVAEV